MSAARPDQLPGDPPPEEQVARMIRVNQAGEYGAKRLYDGQLAVLRGTSAEAEIRHMAEQEKKHRVRPTVLAPFWHVAGFALGAATALLGPKAAMACTEAVEEVIDAHYQAQAERLGDRDPQLKAAIEEFRAEEVQHRDTARAHGAAEAPAYPVLTTVVKQASRTAIWLSERF